MIKKLHSIERAFPWRKFIAVLCLVTVCSVLWADREQTDLANRMIRLHVVANSDNPADQALKLKVRDRILATAGVYLEGQTDVNVAMTALQDKLPELQAAAQSVVREQGYSDPVAVSLEDTWFPTRVYDDFSLPPGTYHALRVVVGKGQGHNWWCVVFPPLCMGSATETIQSTAAAGGLSGDQVSLISGKSESYVVKFKVVEWWETAKHALSHS